MFGKISMLDEDGMEIELFVIEQTRVNNTDYLLVTDSEENDGEVNAFIVKDLSNPEEDEAVYQLVEDDEEFDSIAKIFDELVGDLD